MAAAPGVAPRFARPVGFAALFAVVAWDATAAFTGRHASFDGAIAIAALAACGLLASSLASPARLALAGGTSAPLAALAVFATLGPLRSGDARAAALFAATCLFLAAFVFDSALRTHARHAARETPLTARFAIAAMVGLGGMVLLGWVLGSRLVVQGGTASVPMQFNSALCAVASGVALAHALRGRIVVVAVLCLLVLVPAAATLLQEYAGLRIGIDELLWNHDVVAESVPPGRMAPNTAVALLTGALGALATTRARTEAGWWPVVWGCGLIVAAIVALAGVGYGLQLARLRAWGEHTPMAFPMVLTLGACAVALLALGLGHARARTVPAVLVPLAFALGAMVLSVYAWNALSVHQAAARRAAAMSAAQSVAEALRNFLRTRLGMIEHMAERAADAPADAVEAALRADARRVLRDFPGLSSVAWLEADGEVRWIESPEQLQRFVGTRFDSGAERHAALERARATRATVLTSPLALRAGGYGFIVVVPVLTGDVPTAFLAAAIRYEPLLDAMLATTALGYRIELRDADRTVFLRDADVESRLEVSSSADVYTRQWVATLRPARTGLAAAERLPALVLFGGLMLGALLGVALRLALLARARAAFAEAASETLRREIGERERAQRELESSRNELRDILESSPDGFQMFDREWRFAYMNPRAEQIARRPRAELLGKVLWDEFPESVGDPITERLRRVMELREAVSYESWYAPFQCWFGIVAFPHPLGLAMFIRDITEQHDAYDRLRRSESSLARAQRIAGIGSWEVNLEDARERESMRWSDQTFRIHGIEPGTFVPTLASVTNIVHPEDRDMYLAAMRATIDAGELLSLDHRILLPAGGTRHVHIEADFIFDARGERIRLVGTVQDVTARKQAEEELRLALEGLTSRNRELQDFAFVASHDLQEPLRKIQAFGERLADRSAIDEQGRDYIERMRHAAARMQTLIDDLLAYSRVATRGQAFVPVDLGSVAQEVLTDLESAIERAGAEVRIGPLPIVDADPTQMRQLLQNLLSNSLKFHAEGRTPHVSIDAERFDRAPPEPGARRERWCRLLVRDNGIGFDNRHRERILLPFQRLHGRGEYEGTGIGLAIVRRIVERHGGTIVADGVPGAGATFVIELPLERRSARSESRTTLPMGGAGQT